MASVRLENLRKEFGSVVAVKELTLHFPDGKFAAILGPSGCGKTTTMNMIAGLETPTRGSIYFDERRMNDVPPGKRDVGFVFQNYAIFTHMTVAENIGFGLKIRGVDEATIRREVGKIAELLELTDMLHVNAGRLSVNDMQKVALGRSMIVKPRIFLLDEPFSNLDAAFRAYMRGELKRIQREIGQTMIYVTHDQVEAMSMADHIAVMDFGVLQQFGTPDEIYNQPFNLFVANFIGSPNMNFIPCYFHSEDGKGYLVQKRGNARVLLDDRRRRLLERHPDNQDLIWGARPEHLTLHAQPSQPEYLRATVRFLEPLGPKTIVHLELGDQDTIKVIAHPSYREPAGTVRWVEINPKYLHIFDAKTGFAVR
ncbi:MAG: ABC transporter ATP-binding protein [Anaerolineae bacterium]